MTIKEVLHWGHETLLLTSDSARLDAELLLAHVLKKPVTFLLAHDEQKISSIKWWFYKRFISKRKQGIPVAYLIGHKEFFFLDFEINRHVLVPRPDTEILVECVVNYIGENRKSKIENRNSFEVRSSKFDFKNALLLDIGTGSACIPIAVLKNVEGIKAIATDISRKALKVSRRNVKKHKLKSRINLIRSDLLKNVPMEKLKGKEVIVTANLPYIPKDFQVSPELAYEPSVSLYGGEDGLDVYKRLVEQVRTLKPRALFFELFEDQIAILKTKLPDYHLKYVKDMSGQARVLALERHSENLF